MPPCNPMIGSGTESEASWSHSPGIATVPDTSNRPQVMILVLILACVFLPLGKLRPLEDHSSLFRCPPPTTKSLLFNRLPRISTEGFSHKNLKGKMALVEHGMLGCSVAYFFSFLVAGLLFYYHEAQKVYGWLSKLWSPCGFPLNTRCRVILRSQKGTIVLTTTQIPGPFQVCTAATLWAWALLGSSYITIKRRRLTLFSQRSLNSLKTEPCPRSRFRGCQATRTATPWPAQLKPSPYEARPFWQSLFS